MIERFVTVAAVLCLTVAAAIRDPGARSQEGSVRAVWAVNDGEKIERDDLNSPSKRSNSVWGGRRIKLFGARNEVLAFQLIVEAGDRGIDALAVTLGELALKGGRGKIAYAPPANDPTNYAGRPIHLFAVNYMNVTQPTAAGWIYRPGTPSAPKDPMGWKPVQLVPENAKRGKGGFPLRVEDSGPRQYDIKRAEAERARGRDHWTYNGGRPAGGAIVIDSPATDARVMPWACFKHGVKVYFYWHGVHWRHNRQKQGERIQNVWANPIAFDNRGQPNKPAGSQNFANGDGVLIYPGEEKLHPEEDRGVAGPVSTVQLANLRRGLQDYQYLTMARSLGLDAVVNEALQSIVPRVFYDAKTEVGFAEDGDTF